LNLLLFSILVLFPVATNNIPAKFYKPFSVSSLFVMFCAKIQNGDRRHVKFHFLFDFMAQLHVEVERQT